MGAAVTRLSRWGFPLVAMGTTVASQILIPRVLQVRLSEGEYVAYITVAAAGAYVGLADGGLQWSLLREMSDAHGAGDRPRFAAEARRAIHLCVASALLGCVIAVVAYATVFSTALEAWSGAGSWSFQIAVALFLLAACVMLGAGGFHSVLQYSTGRLLSAQVAGLASALVPTVVLLVCLAATRSLAVALASNAAVLLVVAAGRAWHGAWLYRFETRGVAPGDPHQSLRAVITSGITLKASDVLPAGAFPHMLTVSAPDHVPTAIPARTYLGAARMTVQQFLSLLQVHITRRLGAGGVERAEGHAQYHAAASFLCAVHLLQVGAAAALVVPIFELWLPMRAGSVTYYLPGMLMEQTLLAAALPSSIMFTATGRLRLYGVAKIVGVLLGLVVFVAILPIAREAAFGIGLAASALPHYLLGMYAEVAPFPDFPPRRLSTLVRYGISGIATVACLGYPSRALWVAAALVVFGTLLVPRSATALWRMFRGVQPTKALG
jgi:hypothetical protein